LIFIAEGHNSTFTATIEIARIEASISKPSWKAAGTVRGACAFANCGAWWRI